MYRRALCLALTLAAAVCGQIALAEPAKPQVLASYPNGSYLENLIVDARGAVLFTNYFSKTVEIYRGGKAATFATLDAHPVNLVTDGSGYILLAHAVKFTDGPAAMKDNNVLIWLDAKGKEVRRVKLDGVVFGNGLARTGKSGLLMSDSALGQVWRVDLKTGAAKLWFKDPAIAADPKNPQAPGANGLRRDGRSVLITSSAAKAVFRLAVDHNDEPAGPLTRIAEAPGADDLAVARDGSIYLATHQEQVVRIDAKGKLTTVVDSLIDGCTSAALSNDGKTLYVLGTGGLFEGKKEEAHLIAVKLAP